MDNQSNTKLYELFERVIREMLGTATTVKTELEGTRANGSVYTYYQELLPKEFGQISWGKFDAIIEAHWYPGGYPERRFVSSVSYVAPEFINVRVFLDTWNRGIGVDTSVLHSSQALLVGVNGTVDRHRRRDREVMVCDNEDDVVTEVRKIIEDVFEDYRAETAPPRWDDLYWHDDSSRYDPLDERNYPLDER